MGLLVGPLGRTLGFWENLQEDHVALCTGGILDSILGPTFGCHPTIVYLGA